MALQVSTCLEFVGSDPALKAPTDRVRKLQFFCTTSNMDQSNQNQLTVLSEVMTVVVFGLTGTHAFHGCSTANSITIWIMCYTILIAENTLLLCFNFTSLFSYFLLQNMPKLVHQFTKTLQLLGDFRPPDTLSFAPPPPQPQLPGDATAQKL